MCERCHGIYQTLKDVERPCRRGGCKGTWLDKRGAQLARAVRGKTGDPYPQYCENCEKELGDLDDRQVPCKTDNCTGTWTWTKAAQLAAGVRPEPKEAPEAEAPPAAEAAPPEQATITAPAEGEVAPAVATAPPAPHGKRNRKGKRRREIKPPEKRCQTCLEFLADRKTIEIACQGCKTPIYWPPESQLQTHLGAWSEPSLCGACKRDLTEAQRIAQREQLRQHPPIEGVVAAEGAATSEAASTDGATPPSPPETQGETTPAS
jgi:hypothetical protein